MNHCEQPIKPEVLFNETFTFQDTWTHCQLVTDDKFLIPWWPFTFIEYNDTICA